MVVSQATRRGDMNRENLQVPYLEIVYSCAAPCSLELNFSSISTGDAVQVQGPILWRVFLLKKKFLFHGTVNTFSNKFL